MARQWLIPGGGTINEDGEREYLIPGVGAFKEDQAAAVALRRLAITPIGFEAGYKRLEM